MSLLGLQRIRDLADAAVESGFDDPAMRPLLVAGIDKLYRAAHMPYTIPGLQQILSDLNRMDDVERLADGSVPLAAWLSNAAYFSRGTKSEAVFNRALADVVARTSGAPPIADANELPETKENVVHRDDRLPFAFLALGGVAGRSVAKLRVPRCEAGVRISQADGTPVQYLGTGWLIAPRLLITCHHVLNARNPGEASAADADFVAQATATIAEFDYDHHEATTKTIAVESIAIADARLDYAIVRIAETGREPLAVRRAMFQLASDDYVPLNVIQHPSGLPKQIAVRNNLATHVDDKRVRYFTDTSGGASGSPVLDDLWRAVALHRASEPVTNVQFQGRTTAWINVGTQMKAILDDVHARAGGIAEEIEKSGRLVD
jgi:hypothetical protein